MKYGNEPGDKELSSTIKMTDDVPGIRISDFFGW